MRKQEYIKIITLTHQQMQLHLLGSYVLQNVADDEDLKNRLNGIKKNLGFQELMYLATCNRVTFVFSTDAAFERDDIKRLFALVNPALNNDMLDTAVRESGFYVGKPAIQHLFEVASSLDSLVIGEREILRQLRESFERCRQLGLIGDDINTAMRVAVEAAKDVFSRTRIGEKALSVVALAMNKLNSLKPHKDARILLIGAGQTHHLVAKFLLQKEFSKFAVFNRSLDKAEALAKILKGEAYSLDKLASYTEGFDVMFVCTGSTEAVVNQELYAHLLQGELDKKIVVDLAIPNNVTKEVVELYNLNYIDVEDLKQLAKENLEFRQKEAVIAKDIIQEHLVNFEELFRNRQITKAFKEVPIQVKAVKERAINEIFHQELTGLDENTLDLLQRMMTYMEKGCVNIPMQVAQKAFAAH